MNTYESSQDDDDYASYIASQQNENQEHELRAQELKRRWKESQASTDDVDSLRTGPLHVRRPHTELANLNPGILDSGNDDTEPPIAPM
jgi:hypothetical protein